MKMQGTLKKESDWSGDKYFVEYVNHNGKNRKAPIPVTEICFDRTRVKDGDIVEFDEVRGNPKKCVVIGKEARPAPSASANPVTPPSPGRKSGPVANAKAVPSVDYRSKHASVTSANTVPPAVAPYNFVSFDSKRVITDWPEEEKKWSGQIICQLKALEPLLVCGGQKKKSDNEPADCKFMQVDGQYVIPGTSIKGMLRSVLEIMSYSNMLPVTDKHLFWRRVNEPDYRNYFDDYQNRVHGGYLRKNGASYDFYETSVERRRHQSRDMPGYYRVTTGGFKKPDPKTKQLIHSCEYDFADLKAESTRNPVDLAVVNNLFAQMTQNQLDRWNEKDRTKLLKGEKPVSANMPHYPGLPVFYRRSDPKAIKGLGFCRYFRLTYEYSPFALAFQHSKPAQPDFVTRLFGHVEDGKAHKGRVAVESALVEGKPKGPGKDGSVDVVLAAPKPTCLPLYLVQQKKLKTTMDGKKNKVEDMNSYNDKDAHLRGHKLYWHHNAKPKFFPGRDILAKKPNANVASRLYPLDKEAHAKVVIHVDRLTDCELGGLLQALQLPKGYAHKLGMGKSLGFGSVRLDIEEARVYDIRAAHSSLAARLKADQPAALSQEMMKKLVGHFRETVVRSLRKLGEKCASYTDLAEIRELGIMLNYDKRPEAEQVRTMALRFDPNDRLTKANFHNNGILPPPAGVNPKAVKG